MDRLFKGFSSGAVVSVSQSVGGWMKGVVDPWGRKMEQWLRIVDREDDLYDVYGEKDTVDADRFKKQISGKIGGIVTARKDEESKPEKSVKETLHEMLERLSSPDLSRRSRDR